MEPSALLYTTWHILFLNNHLWPEGQSSKGIIVTYMYILLNALELRQMHGCFEISTMLTLLFLVSGIAANAKIVHE